MLRLPGLGPKKVKALHETRHQRPRRSAERRARTAGSRSSKGFGAKTQEKILGGLAFLAQTGQRVRIDQATRTRREHSGRRCERCPASSGWRRAARCGGGEETVGDIDVLCTSTDPAAVMEAFITLPAVTQVLNQGDTLSSVMLGVGRRGAQVRGDLRVVADDQFAYALHHFTGSQAHNVHLRTKWKEKGFKINEYGLTGPNGPIACKTEADFFAALGLDYIPPELREDTGEIEAAGEAHVAAARRGQRHPRRLPQPHDGQRRRGDAGRNGRGRPGAGVPVPRHRRPLAVADRRPRPDAGPRPRSSSGKSTELNDSLDGFRVFKGTECDILADGSARLRRRAARQTFDYVVASVHSLFGQSREEMTARIVEGGAAPAGDDARPRHRPAAARSATATRSTSTPCCTPPPRPARWSRSTPSRRRLDLDWVHCKRAKALGVKLVINPDAHSTDELELYTYGVDVARRGWLERGDVFNTLTAAQVEKAFGG